MIVKHIPDKNFARIPNSIANDQSLSFKARGILLYCLSKSENWKVLSEDLDRNSPKEGRDSVRAGLRELQEAGYARREPIRNEKGQVTGTEWVISDQPTEGRVSRQSAEPKVGLPDSRLNGDYQRQIKNEIHKEQTINPNPSLEIYECYPLRVGRAAALKVIEKALLNHPHEKLLETTKQFAKLWDGHSLDFCPHPRTWFNQERFLDPLELQKPHEQYGNKPNQGSLFNHRNAGTAGDAAKRKAGVGAAARATSSIHTVAKAQPSSENGVAKEVAGS